MKAFASIFNKVIVFQTWGIGDMVMAMSMLSALRQKLPKSKITLVAGSKAAADIAEGFHVCDEIRVMTLNKMGMVHLTRWFYSIRKENFDAAILCTRLSFRIAQFLKIISGVKLIVGDSLSTRPWGYTYWRPVEGELHRVVSNLNILRLLFPEIKDSEQLTFYHEERSRIYASRIWSDWKLNGHPVLGIHPGSDKKQKHRRLPVEKFVVLIHSFLRKFPEARVLVFIGPHENELIPFFHHLDERVLLLTNTSILQVSAVIEKTHAMVTTATGLGHIGAALGVPSVALAGPTHDSSKPWASRVIRTEKDLQCMPCYDTPLYGHCPYRIECLQSISETRIVDALVTIFSNNQRIFNNEILK